MTTHGLAEKIASKQAMIGVIGLGYVGLPLIRAFVRAGFKTMGFDVDQSKVDKLKAGQSYIKHIDSVAIAKLIQEKQFEPTSDMGRLNEADCIIICVPTPLNESRDPDLSYIEGTAHSIAKTLRKGQLVVLESTTHPTTTRENVLPVLNATGLKAGADYFLAFSPEREDPGNPNFEASTIPKVVGGHDPTSTDLACAMYGHAVVKVVRVSSMEIAEAAKILENTYRAVNIAMVNELKMLYDKMGIDVWEVIDAAKTKPFGFQAFYPGPGLGGHCIPIDPFYLTWLARKWGEQTRFIELAGEINTHMPHYVISQLAEFLNDAGKPIKGSKICILGAAYKKDVDDPRESPSFELMKLLLKRGAVLSYNDPHVPSLPKMRHYPDLPAMTSQPLTPEYLAAQDCVLISTDHSAYDHDFIVKHSKMVLDTRNATKNVKAGREKIFKA
ncbi:nucleotide sugar dehydrogenase [Schlesneria paludicola]|uniref:nucleotide sugar dehydrogenase n=1 Tax=Schlesneria paludicola TaxID=360056 RepID=UPI00029AA616|nr:nucleotide sugar dehydrogenase [Schlesneria paludicola]